ncbi:MAG: phosphonate metabolism protein/1,5-bisphosphokinase (PRPP-forming) PhnN [Pseudomonadota bacterium]
MSSEALGPGVLVAVVGPSGAGKDALLSRAAEVLRDDAAFVFPQRLVTRMTSAAEDHAVIDRAAFDQGVRDRAFALHWEAHGLGYALPAALDDYVRQGAVVVSNVSRKAIPAARVRYANVRVVLVTAPFALRRERLLARQRETADDVNTRLSRSVDTFNPKDADMSVENAGTLDAGVAAFVSALHALSR